MSVITPPYRSPAIDYAKAMTDVDKAAEQKLHDELERAHERISDLEDSVQHLRSTLERISITGHAPHDIVEMAKDALDQAGDGTNE